MPDYRQSAHGAHSAHPTQQAASVQQERPTQTAQPPIPTHPARPANDARDAHGAHSVRTANAARSAGSGAGVYAGAHSRESVVAHAHEKRGGGHGGHGRGRGGHGKFTIVAAVVLVAVLAVAAVIIFKPFGGEVLQGQKIEVTVPEGAGAKQIGQILEDAKVISSASAFSSAVAAAGADGDLRPGTYTFTGGASTDEIIAALEAGGKTGATLSVPEGLTARQIAERVADATDVSADAFYAQTKKAGEYAADYSFTSGAYDGSLEGYLFPKTYTVPDGSTADDIVRMMLDQYRSEFSAVDMTYAKSKNLDAHDVLVLASIVEKESRAQGDMADIAAVFYNRLHAGMALGSDVTTYYAVGKDLTEDLTTEDLASTSPYNTRNPQSRGLPPGPICNPSLAALQAAANPSQASYLYFFYSTKDDRVKFFDDDASFNEAWAAENS